MIISVWSRRFALSFSILMVLAACRLEEELSFVDVAVQGDRVWIFGHESYSLDTVSKRWKRIPVPFTGDDEYQPHAHRLSVTAASQKVLFSTAGGGALWRSDDAGQSWSRVSLDSLREFDGIGGIYFPSENSENLGFAQIYADFSRSQSGIFVTRNGGRDSNRIEGLRGKLVDGIYTEGELCLLIAAGSLICSRDRGLSWQAPIPEKSEIDSLALGEKRVWLLGRNGYCASMSLSDYATESCGLDPASYILFDAAESGSDIVVAASGGRLYISRDNGTTWTVQQLNQKYDLVSVQRLGDGSFIAVGGHAKGIVIPDAGRIAVRSEDLETWIEIDFP